MAQYTPQELNTIFARTTKPLNALKQALGVYPRDVAVDERGNIIARSEYGNFQSPYGWEVDHRVPSALGGLDWYANLRALACADNRRMGGILSQAFTPNR